jgi:hypothetical protein
MKGFSIPLWAVMILLVSNGFSPAYDSQVPDSTILFLAGLTLAGMGACEYLLQSRRPKPVLAAVVGHWRN